MSEAINNSQMRKEMLKHLILQLHENQAPEAVKSRLMNLLRSIPYNEVVEVEQELIAEGLPEDEVLKFCDLHTQVLDGHIDHSKAKEVPPGHPVDTFKQENRAVEQEVARIRQLFDRGNKLTDEEVPAYLLQIKAAFNLLSDLDKHYKRKEYLLFPFIEKAGITGPPKVMWGKHDEIRALLAAAHEALAADGVKASEVPSIIVMILVPALEAIEGMIMKEEEILLPMSMDTLKEEDWYHIYQETPQFGFTLYDPSVEWKPTDISLPERPSYLSGDAIQLSTGSFTGSELEAIFRTLPIDITFVDKNDKVKFFSHGTKKVFDRNRAIIGRDVRQCHPPGSVHIVEQIISDFKSGKENKAAFWISKFMGRFVYIEYTALRSPEGEYLGVMEITQFIDDLRALEGDQRLLSYSAK